MGLPNNMPSPLDVSEGGGGLYDQQWVRVIEAKTEENTKYRHDGKPVPMLVLKVQLLEDPSKEYTELYAAGSVDNWSCTSVWFAPKKTFGGKAPRLSKVNPAGELLIDINNSGFVWDMATFAQTGVKQLEGHLFWVERRDILDTHNNVLKDSQGRNKTRPYLVRWGGNGAQPVEDSEANANQAAPVAPDANSAITDADKKALEAAIVNLLSTPQPQANVISAVMQNAPIAVDKVSTLVSSGWLTHTDRPWTESGGIFTKKQ